MNPAASFQNDISLPDDSLALKERTLLGFETRYARVSDQLRLLQSVEELNAWNKRCHGGMLGLCALVSEQHPLAIFHGDVGTGKTVMAECIANRLAREARTEDSVLFKLSNRVRGSGKVGEIGTLLTEAFQNIVQSAGKRRLAILVIDEGDSLAAARSQENSHHEDKVAVNTLIQEIDSLRSYRGRVVVILCTNRLSMLDPALRRRAAIVEEFKRPSTEERRQLFAMDLAALSLDERQVSELVKTTGMRGDEPAWCYADIRTRLYPAALALAFPDRPLQFDDLMTIATTMTASPMMNQ